ncbi:hypothetical protein [Pedobacter montanisoli]|uniref:Gliding motility protein GldL n=1 Tax=Pedobacter montanisoli TaxID=2923277 RepID=A0ABS9ZTX1_9SPHI|nr:hypothetical protein [Pedobacter montanisoli]MCJ0742045.1 hypothetical protein [Pedobacter montanisoli]
MKSNLLLHYIITISALMVVLAALFKIYQDSANAKFLMLTIAGCLLVAVGQILIIRQKKSKK